MTFSSINRHKFQAFFLFAATTLIFTGCVSNRIKKSVERGDDLTAIELLSTELIKTPDDLELVQLFQQVYPYAIEKRLPECSVDEVIMNNIGSFGFTQEQAISSIASSYPSIKLVSQKNVAAAITQSERVIRNLKEIYTIQTYVARMPSKIGSTKKGVLVDVVKYNNDFKSQYNDSVHSLANFYYNMAEVLQKTGTLQRVEESYSYYVKAHGYEKGIYNVVERAAATAYGIGDYYENLSGINNKKTALSWYDKASSWIPNYRDCSSKIYEINYLIAVELSKTATRTQDYEEVISYFTAAGNYKDAVTLKKEYQYLLAKKYRAEGTRTSFEKAGKLFTSLGDYKDSKQEAAIYDFYVKLRTLDSKDTYRGISLTTSGNKKNDFNHNLSSTETEFTNLNTSVNATDFKVFTKLTESQLVPGQIIDGSSIASQSFKDFTSGNREALTVRILTDSRTLTEVNVVPGYGNSGAAIMNAAYRSLSNPSPVTDFECTQVYSTDDLSLALGFGIEKNSMGNMNSLFYSGDTVMLVKITQKFFTAELKTPNLPVDFFKTGSGTLSTSGLYNVVPYYVSSVDYGRSAYFIITSELSGSELKADIERLRPSRNASRYNNSLYNDTVYKWARNHTAVEALTVSESNTYIRNLEGIYAWIATGFNYSRNSYATYPISFTLKSLYSNDYAVLSSIASGRVRNPDWKPVINNGNNGNNGNNSGNNGGWNNGNNNSGNNGWNNGNNNSGNNGWNNNNNNSGNNGNSGWGNNNNSNNSGNNNNNSTNGNYGGSVYGHEDNKPYGGSVYGNEGQGNYGGSVYGNGGNNNNGNSGNGNNNGNNSGNSGWGNNNNSGWGNNSGSSSGSNWSAEQQMKNNQFIPMAFIGSGNNVYTCYNRDSTTYYFRISKNDLAYVKCIWDSSRIRNLRINGVTVKENKTIDFSNVAGSTISLDYEDINDGNVHKLLVIYVMN